MNTPDINKDVGVIIGRFQVPALHPGHRKLFEIVRNRHKRVLVLLGIPAWHGGTKNPLDYKSRELMIRNAYPEALVSYINDRQTNEQWSQDVDRAIRSIYPVESVILYGGRQGFTSLYCGSLPTIETLEDPAFDTQSGTNIRDAAAALPRDSEDFRAGVIYCSYNRPAMTQMCVDGAIIRHKSKTGYQILLIKKRGERNYRFPGGKLENDDESLESAVKREMREETGTMELGKPVYIGSEGRIPEWRFQSAGIGIASSLFFLPYIYGAAKAGDDAAEVHWLNLYDMQEHDMEPCHRGFLKMLQKWLTEKPNDAYAYQYCQGSKEDGCSIQTVF